MMMNDGDLRLKEYPDQLLEEEADHGSDLRSSGGLHHQRLPHQLQLYSVRTLEVNWQQLCKATFMQTRVNDLSRTREL